MKPLHLEHDGNVVNWNIFRMIIVIVTIAIIGLYVWISMRADSRLATIEFFPKSLAVFFDLNPRFRQIPAFAILGSMCALITIGLPKYWLIGGLILAILSPVTKELAQAYHPTRHFDGLATLYGIFGSLIGWAGVMVVVIFLGLRFFK